MPQLIQPWVVFLVHRILCNANINVAPRKALELIEEFRNDGHVDEKHGSIPQTEKKVGPDQ